MNISDLNHVEILNTENARIVGGYSGSHSPYSNPVLSGNTAFTEGSARAFGRHTFTDLDLKTYTRENESYSFGHSFSATDHGGGAV